jgi:hypothetical protein
MSQRKHHHNGVFVISLADFESPVSRVWLQGPSEPWGTPGVLNGFNPCSDLWAYGPFARLNIIHLSYFLTCNIFDSTKEYSLSIFDYDNADVLLCTKR